MTALKLNSRKLYTSWISGKLHVIHKLLASQNEEIKQNLYIHNVISWRSCTWISNDNLFVASKKQTLVFAVACPPNTQETTESAIRSDPLIRFLESHIPIYCKKHSMSLYLKVWWIYEIGFLTLQSLVDKFIKDNAAQHMCSKKTIFSKCSWFAGKSKNIWRIS